MVEISLSGSGEGSGSATAPGYSTSASPWPPPNRIAATLFDGFFQAPVLLFVMIGLVRLRPWLRPLGLVYAGAAVTNMFFYFVQTFLGPHPPPNTAYYLAFNLPWMIAPAVLGLRVHFARDLREGIFR